MTRGHRLLVGALAAVAAFGFVAPAADAKGKKGKKKPAPTLTSTATATGTTTTHLQTQTSTAKCPAGQIATGGGYNAPIAYASGNVSGINYVIGSRRSDPSSWTIQVQRVGVGSESLSYTAYANCRTPRVAVPAKAKKKGAKKKGAKAAKKKTATKEVALSITETTSSAPSRVGPLSAVASCPTGQNVVGGGFTIPAATDVGQTALNGTSNEGTTGWKVSAFGLYGLTPGSDPGAGGGPIQSFAYCAPKVVPKVTSQTAAVPASPDALVGSSFGVGGTTAPGCPKGTSIAGGGFISPGPLSFGTTGFAFVQFISNYPNGSEWSVDGVNSGNLNGGFTAFAYCL